MNYGLQINTAILMLLHLTAEVYYASKVVRKGEVFWELHMRFKELQGKEKLP